MAKAIVSNTGKAVVFATVSLLTFLVIVKYSFGGFDVFARACRGEELIPVGVEWPKIVKSSDGSITRKIKLKNFSGERIEIIGFNSSCSCSVIAQLPASVEPYGTLALPMETAVENGVYQPSKIELYIKGKHSSRVNLELDGGALATVMAEMH